MDNFRFDMVCEGNKTLKAAIALVFSHRSMRGATGYIIRPAHDAFVHDKYKHLNKPKRPERLIFLWSNYESAEGYVPFPFEMDADGCADFASRWLGSVDYGREPDHDGDNGKGWRVYNEAWGHVEDLRATIIAVSPAWAMYGK